MSQSTTITEAFIGYLPDARVAEFQDTGTGVTVVAAVATNGARNAFINYIIGLRAKPS